MHQKDNHPTPTFSWNEIDLVFLDMDGTLLDKYFDDYFWEQYVPKMYAKKNNIDGNAARQNLLQTYKRVENTLEWTDLNYWSKQLDLDIPALKKEIDHLVAIHPHVIDFLVHIRKLGKAVYLVTNAHPKALKIKLDKIQIANYFDKIICSKDVGAAKEQVVFWDKLQQLVGFNKQTTLFADDTEKVLLSAKEYGFVHLVHIAKPSSKESVRYSSQFPSIADFRELMD